MLASWDVPVCTLLETKTEAVGVTGGTLAVLEEGFDAEALVLSKAVPVVVSFVSDVRVDLRVGSESVDVPRCVDSGSVKVAWPLVVFDTTETELDGVVACEVVACGVRADVAEADSDSVDLPVMSVDDSCSVVTLADTGFDVRPLTVPDTPDVAGGD